MPKFGKGGLNSRLNYNENTYSKSIYCGFLSCYCVSGYRSSNTCSAILMPGSVVGWGRCNWRNGSSPESSNGSWSRPDSTLTRRTTYGLRWTAGSRWGDDRYGLRRTWNGSERGA